MYAACDECGAPERGCQIECRGERALAELCQDCAGVCPTCNNERFVVRRDDRGYDIVAPCRCRRLIDRIDAFNNAHVPGRYGHCTLQTFEHKGGNQREVHQRVVKHVEGYDSESKGLLLSGAVGTGKTHLLVAVLRDLTLRRGVVARFIEFTHLLSDIKEGFSQGKSEAEALGPLSALPVLGIDELGKGTATEWQISVLDELISRRYNQRLTTYFTTNLPISAGSSSPNQAVTSESSRKLRTALERVTIEERVGPRIFSRLHEMADFIEVKGPDARRSD